jgi:hypothetical protein
MPSTIPDWKSKCENITLIITCHVGYFPKLPFLAINEALAFWGLLGILTKPWVMPFFSKCSAFGSTFHLHMISNLIQDQFPVFLEMKEKSRKDIKDVLERALDMNIFDEVLKCVYNKLYNDEAQRILLDNVKVNIIIRMGYLVK